jgi:glycosyltransferase involved in cell wall biosynthesis
MSNKHELQASVIVTCKGRLHHLRESLPTMLRQECSFDFKVIVVDYGCPKNTFEWCRSFDLRRLVALQVLDNTEPFNVSRARNCGARQARGSVLAFVDADMRLRPNWLATAAAPILNGEAGLCNVAWNLVRNGWDRAGTCAVSAGVFHAVRGYDEALRGWGMEDCDFYHRCKEQVPVAKFVPNLLLPLNHGNDLRVQHYEEKSIADSTRKQSRRCRERAGEVNPDGYGRCRFELFVGREENIPPANLPAQKRVRRRVRRPDSGGQSTRLETS